MTQPSLFSYEEVDLILRGEGDNDFVGMSAIDGLIAAVVAEIGRASCRERVSSPV